MESSVHREVQALFGGGTVETCHGDMVRRHFPTLRGIYCRGGDADGDVGIGGGRLAVLP